MGSSDAQMTSLMLGGNPKTVVFGVNFRNRKMLIICELELG